MVEYPRFLQVLLVLVLLDVPCCLGAGVVRRLVFGPLVAVVVIVPCVFGLFAGAPAFCPAALLFPGSLLFL